jgi:integrase
VFCNWLEKHNLGSLKLSEIDPFHIITFLDYTKNTCNNLTRNNYLTWLKAIFGSMVKRGYLPKNPAQGIKKITQQQTRTIAISPEHLKEIIQLIKEQDTETYIFCLFIFYTFVRPIELRRIKVGQVNLEQNKMVIYGNQSKNKKTEYVMIPDPLKRILVETKFLERNPDEPLFSDHRDLQYSRNKYSTLFSRVVKENGFPKEYTLYCLKHTGVVEYYKKGCGIKFIKEQCRHSNLAMTDKYLKSLGLFENEEIIKNAPEI